MERKQWRGFYMLIVACLLGLLVAMPAAAEGTGTVELPASLTLKGNVPTDIAPYEFTLKAQDAANPMPAGAESGIKTVTMDKAGEINFGSIEFTNIGEYVYTVSQKAGAAENFTYDSRVYTATVYVEWKSEVGGPVAATLVLAVSGSTKKPDGIAFENIAAGSVVTPPTPPVVTPPTPPVVTPKPGETPKPGGSTGGGAEPPGGSENSAPPALQAVWHLLPQTSDDAPLLLWWILAGGSLIGVVCVLLRKHRKT